MGFAHSNLKSQLQEHAVNIENGKKVISADGRQYHIVASGVDPVCPEGTLLVRDDGEMKGRHFLWYHGGKAYAIAEDTTDMSMTHPVHSAQMMKTGMGEDDDTSNTIDTVDIDSKCIQDYPKSFTGVDGGDNDVTLDNIANPTLDELAIVETLGACECEDDEDSDLSNLGNLSNIN